MSHVDLVQSIAIGGLGVLAAGLGVAVVMQGLAIRRLSAALQVFLAAWQHKPKSDRE